jgi:acetolactate synthase-1/2/3 large subunit
VPGEPSTPSGTRPAAEVLARQLESYGVDTVFGTCGHTNIALLDALSRSPIRFVIARHEQAAAHAADGYARATGKPGVLLTHVGPGLMNAVTGVASAGYDSVPLVAISGDVPSYFHGRHPHQEVNLHRDADQASIYRPFTKRVWEAHRAEDLPRFLERAFWTATSGRPGAVLLDVPMDLLSRRIPAALAAAHPLVRETGAPALADDVAERIARMLVQADSPLIYIGGGLRGDAGRSALTALAEHLDIPIAHSLMGKGTLPDRHPLLLGITGFWGSELANRSTREADVVLALGTRFAETDASSWDPRHTWAFPPGKLVQIDLDPQEIGRNYPVELGAVADTASAMAAIGRAARTLRPEPMTRPGLRERIAASREQVFGSARERGRSEAFPLEPERILADLRAALPADAILVTDVGWNKNGVAQCYDLPPEGRFITPGGSSTMGFGPAAAVGVQVALPQRTVVALVGDGGMSAQLPALPMAVEQGAPVLFVVMNNSAHGTIADLEQAHYSSGYGCEFRDPDGRPYSPDFAALGRACGADGYRIGAPGELAKALCSALERRRPAVIDVPMVNTPVPTPGHWNIKDIYRGDFAQPHTGIQAHPHNEVTG